MKYLLVLLTLIAAVCIAEEISFSFDIDSVGVIIDDNINQNIGTGFVIGQNHDVITCAHVVAGRTNLVYDSIDATNKEVRLSLKYILPRFDLAVLAMSEWVPFPLKPITIGDIRRVRPGDTVMYVGWKQGTKLLSIHTATVTATGSVMNDGTIVEFLEFEGQGRPGYSGGPVFSTKGEVVAIMREAWTKRGVKGGPEVLINRAFSVAVLSTLASEVFTRVVADTNATSNLSLLEASGVLKTGEGQ